MNLIDIQKWHAVWNGCFNYSIVEREQYWTLDDDIDFMIACSVKNLIGR